MLLGHWLEMRWIGPARGALAALAALLPDTAERVAADGTATVPVHDVRVGDVVLVGAGGHVPINDKVLEGAADVDESLITGESRPSQGTGRRDDRRVGSRRRVAPGPVRGRGVRRRCRGSCAFSMRPRPRNRAPRRWAIARPRSCSTWHSSPARPRSSGGCSSATQGAVHPLRRRARHRLPARPRTCDSARRLDLDDARCPERLLVKDRLALENARIIDTVIFDETGTLTRGETVVVEVAAVDGRTGTTSWRWPRPWSRTPSTRSDGRSSQRSSSGDGPSAGDRVRGAGRPWCRGHGQRSRRRRRRTTLLHEVELEPSPSAEAWDREGRTVLHVDVDGRVCRLLAAEDEIRPESAEDVAELHGLGVRWR